ncbi:MAG: NAD-glutamate dehydrogenase [Xanthobacteraceae bacterium]
MGVAEFLSTDQERTVYRLVEQAATLLGGPNSPVPQDFMGQFLGRAVAEDLTRYRPNAIADITRTAWDFLATRKVGTPKISLTPPRSGEDGLEGQSILEIVNDNMPFLVDSVLAELNEQGIEVRFVVHPLFSVERDADGRLRSFLGDRPAAGTAVRESFIHIHVASIADDVRRTEIVQALEQVLADVRICVQDWRPMLVRVKEVIDDLKINPPPLPRDSVAEAIAFLEWLMDNNFVLLGVRNYVADAQLNVEPVAESGLGILRRRDLRLLRRSEQPAATSPEIREFLNEPKPLIVTKANIRSRVHRRAYLDSIGVKRFNVGGSLAGEFRIAGLFTSTAYTRSVASIPYLRRKVDTVLSRAGFDPSSHSGKALVNVLENYPRDELFHVDEDTLYNFALAILALDERPRVRVLARRDRFDRFVSVLVYVPRERFSSTTRGAIGEYLAQAFKGYVTSYHPFFPEGPLVRVHFIIGRSREEAPDLDRSTLEQAVGAIVRTWMDELANALARKHDPITARTLVERYRTVLSPGYQDAYAPVEAVEDIRIIEGLSSARPLSVDFHRTAAGPGVRLKVWSYQRPIPLSERVPVLENMGFRVVDEQTYSVPIEKDGGVGAWLHDIALETTDGAGLDIDAQKQRLEACFLMVMRGVAENDGYNALVLKAGLMWRDVALIRTLSRFLRQIRVAFSQDYMWTTLRKHAAIAADIVALFHARFDPRIEPEQRALRQVEIHAAIEEALQSVDSLDEDRIIRHFVNAVRAAVRTNFFQLDTDGQPKPVIAIKFASRDIDACPRPRPLYEIFVYSPRVEGVHLRFGKVARGGIRWSDRPQDFRTEILGLVKAQQVKNAVIVPVGAKGGFVPKQPPVGGPREAVQAEGIATYKIFISTLLDITDNLGLQDIVAPTDVVRHDGDDPYLVVAADKGTATFSDTANAISDAHGFWLGDAFASGGSAGYDHKKMGITARGAWEAVKRHFREIDVDITAAPFTVAGIGDMSGDVFGNGMLRERTIRLVAAFDHRDIFLDPSPAPEKTLSERRRLFDLPRSSWQDFDKTLISKGGGVFSRNAKEIKLAPEAQQLLGLPTSSASPQEVIRAILRSPVDLLWFGGIGTYIRAENETDDAVGDRANDTVRVAAAELRCKVIGEGANLGVTQRGRVEASMRGVRLNSDAIDNSAGVNTSDIEVNIKIALSLPMRERELTVQDRNALLQDMSEDVAALVLRNNYQQPLAISLADQRGLEDLGFQQRLMHVLEARGELDREVEFLPDDMELGERKKRGRGLTRPELAVMLAYAKLSLYSELLSSSVPDDPYLGRELERYFPGALGKRFPDALKKHRLRREIIATQLANSMINRGGPSLVVRIADQTGAAADRIATAFAAVRDSYGMTALNTEIDGLDNKIPGQMQIDLYRAVQDLLLDRLVWFLRYVDLSAGLASVVQKYQAGIAEVAATIEELDKGQAPRARQAELVAASVPEPLARRMASLPVLTTAPDIVLVAERTGRKIADVSATYFATEAFFRLDQMAQAARRITVTDYFDRLALDRALDSIGDAERRLTAMMLHNGGAGTAAVEAWTQARRGDVDRTRGAVHEIVGSGLTLSKLSVAASLLGDLARG